MNSDFTQNLWKKEEKRITAILFEEANVTPAWTWPDHQKKKILGQYPMQRGQYS